MSEEKKTEIFDVAKHASFDPMMHEAMSEYAKALNLNLFKSFDPELTLLTLKLKFYPIYIPREDDNVFIPTGTPEKPSGIRKFTETGEGNMNGKLIIFIEEDKDKSNPNNFTIVHKDSLKEAISRNKDSFERAVGPDYKTMGFRCSKEYFNKIITDYQFLPF